MLRNGIGCRFITNNIIMLFLELLEIIFLWELFHSTRELPDQPRDFHSKHKIIRDWTSWITKGFCCRWIRSILGDQREVAPWPSHSWFSSLRTHLRGFAFINFRNGRNSDLFEIIVALLLSANYIWITIWIKYSWNSSYKTSISILLQNNLCRLFVHYFRYCNDMPKWGLCCGTLTFA